MVNILLKRLRNDIVDFRIQMDQLKKSLIETNKINICDGVYESINPKKDLLKLNEIKQSK